MYLYYIYIYIHIHVQKHSLDAESFADLLQIDVTAVACHVVSRRSLAAFAAQCKEHCADWPGSGLELHDLATGGLSYHSAACSILVASWLTESGRAGTVEMSLFCFHILLQASVACYLHKESIGTSRAHGGRKNCAKQTKTMIPGSHRDPDL